MAKYQVKVVARASTGSTSSDTYLIDASSSNEASEIAKSRHQAKHPNDRISVEYIKKC